MKSWCNYFMRLSNCLLLNETIISSPADIINWLSVWSVASQSSSISIAKINEVSPFSRCWIKDTKKPDMVHFDEILINIDLKNWIWETWFLHISWNIIAENIWTSFSAPLISWIAWNIYSYLNQTWMVDNTFDMTKALLLHSARYSIPHGSLIEKRKSR